MNEIETKQKIRINGELALFIALHLLSIGIVFFIICDIGITPVQGLSYVLSTISSWSLGTWNFIIQAILFIFMLLIVRSFNISYAVSFVTSFLYSFILDFYVAIINITVTNNLEISLLYIAGYILLCIGVAIFFICGAPLMPYDMFLRELVRVKKLNIGRAKFVFDFCCVFLTFFLSMVAIGRPIGIGIGTLIFALFVGPTISIIIKFLNKYFEFFSIFKDKNIVSST